MTPLEMKLAIIAICAVLKLIGEEWWHNAERFILPLVLGISISVFTHVWWLGFTTLLMIADIVQGYGPKSLLYKYLSDAGARGMWLFLVAVLAGIGPFLDNHLAWYLYLPYCIGAGILGATLRNILNIVSALICGGYIACILLLLR